MAGDDLDVKKIANGNSVISDDEAAIYDRQIRLWGVEAQKKIRSCNVLLIGLNGLGSEIAKNIVLAGIASLDVWDDQVVTPIDTLSNLFTGQSLGQNRALASENEIKNLNPMVQVTAKPLGTKDILEASQLQAYNVIILNNASKSEAVRLNNLARTFEDTPKYFYYTGSHGMYAYSFIDLGKKHTFVTEELIDQSTTTIDSAATNVSEASDKKLVDKSIEYCSLEVALNAKCGKANIGLTKRTSPLVILVHTLLEFYQAHGRFPNDDSTDGPILKSLAEDIVAKLGVAETLLEKLNNEIWFNNIYGELSPIAAIAGGVLAQDIIRAVSQKDATMKNVFLFSGISMNGVVENIGR